MKLRFPSGITPSDFLETYWQKRPLFMPGALAEYDFPLAPEELAGLACEPEVESRLVRDRDFAHWELLHGPFDEAFFTALPDEHWTLLVQDLDKYLPEVARLLAPFEFIPRWRFDDVMVSYASPGGSVGPHVDTYDVFLVQGMGRRRWQIQTRPDVQALLPELPVRILAHFEPEEEWVLEQGDVLYLPPGVAHWGIAETPTMNWSVGLRAPTFSEMIDSFGQFLIEELPAEDHYRDPPFGPVADPSRIDPGQADTLFRQLARWLDDPDLRRQWFGRFMTETKPHLTIAPLDPPLEAETLSSRLQRGERLGRHPFARFAWSPPLKPQGPPWLFVSGEAHPWPDSEHSLQALCNAPLLDWTTLASCLAREGCRALLTELVNQGQLEFRSG